MRLAIRSAQKLVRRPIVSSMIVSVVIALVGGIAPSAASVSAKRTYGVGTAQSEVIAEKSVKWTSNVAVSLGNGSWTFRSNGLPASRFLASHYAVPANPFDVSASGASVIASVSVLRYQGYDYTLPLTLVYSKKTTTTNQGPNGFLLDGDSLYNPSEANHSTVATSDNFVITVNGVSASFLDTCGGHPGPGGQYRYHGLPACLVSYASGGDTKVTSASSTTSTATSAVIETNTASKRPLILGFDFDGYGIYDNIAMNGATIRVASLDGCNGIFSPVPGYPHGVYHYVLENVKGARSSIGCYHGVVSSVYTRALRNALNGPTDLARSKYPMNSRDPASAFTLAANRSEDAVLRWMLTLSGVTHFC